MIEACTMPSYTTSAGRRAARLPATALHKSAPRTTKQKRYSKVVQQRERPGTAFTILYQRSTCPDDRHRPIWR
jgi:hypothetical protein